MNDDLIMRSRLSVLSILTITLFTCCHGEPRNDTDAYLSRLMADMWLEGADVVRIIWRDCSKKLVDVKDVIDHKEYFPKFVRCMKRKTLRALDRSLSPDIVPVADGVNLVRFELVDRAGNIVPENETRNKKTFWSDVRLAFVRANQYGVPTSLYINNVIDSTWTEKELDEGEWRSLALQRMAKVLRTHVIKFDFENGKNIEKVEYRGRRRQHMMTMMMFGIVSIGMVFIPMGFQFLAVLGGKALLLAKMALILASIQGLKKIAASPLNYGFYHTYPPPFEHYDRRSQDDWPPPAVMPATSPPSMSAHNPWSVETGYVKVDRIQIAQPQRDAKESKALEIVTWRPKQAKDRKGEAEPRLYPIYAGPESSAIYTSIDSPSPLVDLTTRPGEVQADYSLELPFNRFHFQSPATAVPA